MSPLRRSLFINYPDNVLTMETGQAGGWCLVTGKGTTATPGGRLGRDRQIFRYGQDITVFH